jgi:hypothetical protein
MLVKHQNKETATQLLAEGSRCTAGLFVCAYGHHTNGDDLVFVKRSIEKREQTKLKKNRER